MMRKTITRTLTKATVNGYTVEMVEGKPNVKPLESVTAWGKLTEKEASKVLDEKYGKDAKAIVGEIVYTDETYEIDVETFVEMATKI